MSDETENGDDNGNGGDKDDAEQTKDAIVVDSNAPLQVGVADETIERMVASGKELVTELTRPDRERIAAQREVELRKQDIEQAEIEFSEAESRRDERRDIRASNKAWFLLVVLVIAAAYMYIFESKLDALLLITHGLAFGFGYMVDRGRGTAKTNS